MFSVKNTILCVCSLCVFSHTSFIISCSSVENTINILIRVELTCRVPLVVYSLFKQILPVRERDVSFHLPVSSSVSFIDVL